MATQVKMTEFRNAICDKLGLPHGSTNPVILEKLDQVQAARKDEAALDAWAAKGRA